ncbi:MAG: PilZ domain-containing protein [Myxococcaceae bacterium]
MSTDDDKRKQQRIPVEIWIEAERAGELYFQRASNLSVGGAYFVQTVPMPVGEKVTLKFSLPGEAHEIVCDGEIVNAKELGMGVSFINLKDPDRVRIQKLIDFHLRAAPPVPAEKPKASPKNSGRGVSTSGSKPAARNSKTGIPAVKIPKK